MPAISWYNENRNRAFPFLAHSLGTLPLDAIVDAGFMLGADSGFQTATDQVYLQRVRRLADVFYFEFVASSLGESYPLIFSRAVTDERYVYEELDEAGPTESVSNSLSESEDYYALCGSAPWSGYLVTGDLAALADLLANGETWERGTDEAIVEPALLYNRTQGMLASVNLANDDRTRAAGDGDCPGPTWPYEVGVIFVGATCLQGDILWQPGYNCLITQDPRDNSITIAAAKKAGAGEPCNEQVPLFPGETPAVGATNDYLDGSLSCFEVLRAINGSGGPLLTLIADTGVSILPDPLNHKITVDVNMRGMAVCYTSTSESIA